MRQSAQAVFRVCPGAEKVSTGFQKINVIRVLFVFGPSKIGTLYYLPLCRGTAAHLARFALASVTFHSKRYLESRGRLLCEQANRHMADWGYQHMLRPPDPPSALPQPDTNANQKRDLINYCPFTGGLHGDACYLGDGKQNHMQKPWFDDSNASRDSCQEL